jgi:hypothetical protein
MAKMTSTGMALGVSVAEPATANATGYAALTFTPIGSVVDVPEYGPNAQVVESNPLATGITEKFKGFVNYGSVALGLEIDFADAGQAIFEAAVQGATKDDRHSFKLSYPDGTVEYFGGKVFSYTRNPGSANSMVGSTVNVEIETPIVRVAAP